MSKAYDIFSAETVALMLVINAALACDSEIVIVANERGLSISLNGRPYAWGTSPGKLREAIFAKIDQARQAIAQQGE
jgi:hypothetical protein